MKKINKWLVHYFGITPREARGALALFLLIVVIFLLPLSYHRLKPNESGLEADTDRRQLDSMIVVLVKNEADLQKERQERYAKKYPRKYPAAPAQLFHFDPNSIDSATWVSLGVPRFLAARIVRYRSKGGKFKQKSDLAKIYNFPEALYQKLHPYIVLPAEQPEKHSPKHTDSPAQLFHFDPNSIDSATWVSLGVPHFLAARILRYRSKGGKFKQKSDLAKIYNFPEALYQKLHPYIVLPAEQSEKHSPKHASSPAQLFHFDPNSIDSATWVSLGVPHFLAARIVRYRSKGGEFRQKSDLAKIYNFPEALYQKLHPYIVLPEKKTGTQTFELNAATAENLQQIRGIGEKTAARILKFRNSLGGFYSKNQLYTIYGLDSLVCNRLCEAATLAPEKIRKISINRASAKVLRAHPYISYKLADVIVKYRQQHGDYKTAEDLKKIIILKDDTHRKLRPYLLFD